MFMAGITIQLIQNIFFIAIGLLGLGLLVGFHELGHFLFCKLFKIRTPSFSIGMGPKVLTKKIGDTEFALSAIPIGGYVEIAGAAEVGQGAQKEASSRDPYSFAVKPYWQKLMVMIGGILFNLIFAYIVFSGLFYIGMPKFPIVYQAFATTVISEVAPDSPAAKAGLQTGDKIVAINQQQMNNPQDIINFIKNKPNTNQEISVERSGQVTNIPVTVGQQTFAGKDFGFLGIDFYIPRFSPVDSIINGIKATNLVIKEVYRSFKGMFTDRSMDKVGGPLMVISQTIKGAEKGAKVFMLLLAFISINLAMINLIPLPIMDGGQILFYTIEAIIRRPLPDQVRIYIHYACWIAVLVLVLYLSAKDILRMTGH
jgi:regulator of sigma E protease